MRRLSRLVAISVALVTTGCGSGGPLPTAGRGFGIVGGEETTGWPEVVAYLVGGAEAGTALCTGTLIAPDAVLTAAHCALLGGPDDAVYIGSSVFEPGTVVDVADAVAHDGYDPDSGVMDLAVLRLAHDVGTEPVALNTERVDSDWIGTSLRVVGFGNDDGYTGTSAGIKRETDVEVIWVDSHLIVHETEGHNTCSGDSGGPALVEREDGWVLVAVTSFVYPLEPDEDACDGGGGEGRVDASLEWIAEQSGLEADLPQDDDDDEVEVSYLEDDDRRGGCAADHARQGRGQVSGRVVALFAALAFILIRRAPSRPGARAR